MRVKYNKTIIENIFFVSSAFCNHDSKKKNINNNQETEEGLNGDNVQGFRLCV